MRNGVRFSVYTALPPLIMALANMLAAVGSGHTQHMVLHKNHMNRQP